MTSVLSMETTADLSQQCSSCDGSSARCWCLDCNEALCDVCMSAHRRVTVTRSHRILNQPPAGRVSTPPTKFCRLHPSEPLKLFCFTCNQLTCRDCQLMAHMNHRYQFVSEALGSLKKQLEVWVQSIRAHRDTARQSLLDMETRLQNIVECESHLKTELQQSYSIIIQHLEKRMEDHLKEVKKVCESESERIQRRMMKVKQLQQKQQSLTETAEKAENTNDLSALLTYRAQIELLMKDLPDQDLSPPQTMSQLMVLTNSKSLEALLNFGELEVSWIPFSVSQTSNQNRDTPAASSSSSSTTTTSTSSSLLTPTCPAPSCRPLPQTRNTSDTDSPVPVNCPSSSWKSSSNQLSAQPSSCPSNQSNAPVTTTTTVSSAQTVECPSSSTVKTSSHLETNPSQVLLQINPVQPVSTSVSLQPVSVGFPPSAGPSSSCTVLKLVQPSMVLNQPRAPHQNQPAAALMTKTQTVYQTVYQVSRQPFTLLSVMPQLPMLLSQTAPYTLPGNTWPKQQKNCGTPPIKPIQPGSTLVSPQPDSVGFPPSAGPSSCSTSFTSSNFSYSSSATPPTSTCLAPSCRPLPQTRNTSDTDSPVPVNCPSSSWKSSSNQLSPQPSSCPSNQSNAPVTTTTTVSSAQSVECPSSSTVKTSSHLETNPSQVLLQILPVAASHTALSRHKETSNHQPLKDNSSTITSGPLSSDISPSSSSLKHQQQSPVVRAVADSACDRSLQQVAARQQEPAENEPTSTVSEETEPAGKPSAPEVFHRDAEESSSVIGHTDCSLSQWQPRVSLFRLPVSPPRPGRPLPAFRLVRGDAEDEIYLEDMSKDTQSHVDDITDESSPESPVTLVIVTCSACGSANGSIICSACGRGYHRDCHVPPVGPDIWSEWICSLCQDLSDPSDPYSSDRPQRPQSPCLSLLDQRRCESLLLYLKVEGCSRLSEFGRVWSRLKLMSERLTLRRSPAYQTAAEFVSDVWSLFMNTSQDDDVLNKLQESFQSRLMETFSSELHPSVLMPPRGGGSTAGRPDDLLNTKMSHGEEVVEGLKGSKVTSEKQKVITSESKLKETKKRLREFLDLMGTSGFKRGKRDKMED